MGSYICKYNGCGTDNDTHHEDCPQFVAEGDRCPHGDAKTECLDCLDAAKDQKIARLVDWQAEAAIGIAGLRKHWEGTQAGLVFERLLSKVGT
jgi:hypothetical protein